MPLSRAREPQIARYGRTDCNHDRVELFLEIGGRDIADIGVRLEHVPRLRAAPAPVENPLFHLELDAVPQQAPMRSACSNTVTGVAVQLLAAAAEDDDDGHLLPVR